MGLRPLGEAPPWAIATRVMELRPTQTLYMFHQPIRKFPSILISCWYVFVYKQPIIQLIVPNSYTIKQYLIFISTSYSNHGIIPQTFSNKAFRSSKQATTSVNHSNNSTKTCPSLAQARRSHSSEPLSRLNEGSSRGIMDSAISRSGETSSPERDHSSLKMKTRELSNSSSSRS